MKQQFVADVINIEDLDGSVGLSFIERDDKRPGTPRRYFSLASGDGELEAEFNEQCNACRNRIALITSGPGHVVVQFMPESEMRQGDTSDPYGPTLEELTIRFAPVMAAADLSALLLKMAEGICEVATESRP